MTWLPDGRRLLSWVVLRNTAVLRSAESREVRSVPGISGPSDLRLSADGRTLMVNRAILEGDIWLLTLKWGGSRRRTSMPRARGHSTNGTEISFGSAGGAMHPGAASHLQPSMSPMVAKRFFHVRAALLCPTLAYQPGQAAPGRRIRRSRARWRS